MTEVINEPTIFIGEKNEDPGKWYIENEALVNDKLLNKGAVLLRGFKMAGLTDFDKFVGNSISQNAKYLGGATPRKNLTRKVSTSTEFPKEQEISLHNELSYEKQLPEKLIFCCLLPSLTGGQTQLSDVHQVYNLINTEIIDEFKKRNGWKLVRNFGRGFGPTIKNGFGTEDIDLIRRDALERDIEIEIIDDRIVRTTQTVDAVKRHPVSGIPLWVNHIAFWHKSSFEPEQLKLMSDILSADEFPYNTLFGDGTVIPDDYIANIRAAYSEAEFMFDWVKGDILIVDNYRIAHGRKPYTGKRKVLVSMGK
ncbi:TauD/TfdA family dioxygenase [Pseudoalteromonas sp. MMG007]|uniref:TauD/TfdA family dioxygenase n=1 Tax=Pseudoalteromonas sp. MMG007 TaxID=2822684 RepID=UPI001B3939ED|nr:TauD/TfdA family dioxygenase [Pseudoalteromonas sp. MMG007]MBQ4859998.1 TauD/TfdA family dioxygenase [Pseudoalteromonas sp. MMG007]